mgnify:CR=1 FL=1
MITEKQIEKRKGHIGSSDMAAILGLDPFRTAYDVWIEKTGRLETPVSNSAMVRGRYLEDAILRWFETDFGKKIIKNQYRALKQADVPVGVNLDAIVKDEGRPVEAKSVGPYNQEKWGTPGTDEVPDRVIIQCAVQLLCVDSDLCYVPVYLPYRDFNLFYVYRNKELEEIILEHAHEFWEKYVLTDTPPEGVLPTLPYIRNIRRTAKTISIPSSLFEAYDEVNNFLKEAEAKKEQIQAAILAAMGDAEEGVDEITGKRFVLSERSRTTIDVNALRKEQPDIAKKYEKKTTYKVFLKKGE